MEEGGPAALHLDESLEKAAVGGHWPLQGKDKGNAELDGRLS